MSTATAEPPAKKPAADLPALPPLEQGFAAALKQQDSQVDLANPEGKKPEAKPAAEKPKAEPEKPAADKPAEAAKPEKPAKKKSALDAALSDEPAESKPEPDEVQQLLESKDPNWDKARETMKRQSEELKSFREKVAKASEPPPELAQKIKTYEKELAELREQNAKMKDSIVALDVRFDPDTQQKFQVRDNGVMKLSVTIKENGGNEQAFIDAMAMPLNKRGAPIDAILETITSPRARSIIERKLAEIEIMDEQLDELVSKPQESFEQLSRKRELEAQQREEHVAQVKAATFDNIGKKLQKESPLFRPSPPDAEGAEQYNSDLKTDMEKAVELAGPVTREEAAIAAFKAQRFDTITKRMMEEAKAQKARISELEDSLAKFEGAEPGYRGGKKPAGRAAHEVPLEEAFFGELRKQEPV